MAPSRRSPRFADSVHLGQAFVDFFLGHAANLGERRGGGIECFRRMTEEEIHERLTQVHGIGEWSVQMFLISRLGRPDVLPVHDYGIRKGFQRVYGHKDVPKPQVILEHGERWRPYRSIASWYLWRALEEKQTKPKRKTEARKISAGR